MNHICTTNNRGSPHPWKMAAGREAGSSSLGAVGDGDRRGALVSIKEKDKEHISKVLQYKEEGNRLFRTGCHTREAMKQYHNAMMYLKVFDDNAFISALNPQTQNTSLSNMPEEAKQQVVQLNISVANNLAACALKEEKWESALRHVGRVLQFDPSNVKALYRRGVAYLNLKRIDEAVADLLRASELNPKDAAVRKQLEIAQCELKVYQEKEKKLFQGMFKS